MKKDGDCSAVCLIPQGSADWEEWAVMDDESSGGRFPTLLFPQWLANTNYKMMLRRQKAKRGRSMMPLSLAVIGEENIIRKIGGSPEVKKHLEVFSGKRTSF